jgi:NADH-quinone oxidoreductase subunit L
MEGILVPLALRGLFGGMLNLPSFLGGGWLGEFFSSMAGGGGAEPPHTLEIALQAVAGLIALAGLAVAHHRYGGKNRQERLAAAAGPVTRPVAFFLAGWRFDDLYRLLFIRPFEALSRFFWERCDEGVIDDSLDRLASLLGRSGVWLGSWTTGRVSVYLMSFAAGMALIMTILAWMVL